MNDAQDTQREDARRFGGVARLLGDAALERLRGAHVVVAGVGGVGSWAAEALARSGVGKITLIDLDHVAESNINRQVHALEATLGAAKIEAMAARIAQISPACAVQRVEEFVTHDNAERLLAQYAIVIDAVDQPRAKAAMIAVCQRRGQTIVVCGAAGAIADPLALRCSDLASTRGDRLLASVRSRLRREHGFTRARDGVFHVRALHFDAQRSGTRGTDAHAGAALACAGYGSIVTVTATMGFAAAALAIESATKGA